MKPSSRSEREVDALIPSLPEITDKQMQWGEDHAIEPRAVSNGRTSWCSHCGGSFAAPVLADAVVGMVCPHCGRKLKVSAAGMQRHLRRLDYYSILQVCHGWQVRRVVMVEADSRKGQKMDAVHYEVAQFWLKPGDEKLVSLECKGRGFGQWYSRHPYNLNERPTFKRETLLSFTGTPVAPGWSILPEYRRYGLGRTWHGVDPLRLMRAVVKKPEVETLWKAGQYGLADWAMYNRMTPDLWGAMKICIRNGYRVKDASLWVDMVKSCHRLGLDIRSPRYLCPDNLRRAHDQIIDRESRQAVREILAAKSKENTSLKERIRPFQNIVLRAGNIRIRVMEDTTDFKRQGDILHQCVFKAGYYRREDSLILAAIVAGKRTETIEIDLETFHVLQCRGDHNEDSSHHDAILSLVNAEMWRYKKAAAIA